VGQATLTAEMGLDFLPYVFKISTSYAQVKNSGIAKEMEIPVPESFFIKPEDTTFRGD